MNDVSPHTDPVLGDLVPVARWVAWRNDLRKGKTTKVPYCGIGREAEADNPATWLPHDEAAAVADAIVNGTGGGVGIELGGHHGMWLAGIDLDTCRDPQTGKLEPWAQAVLDRFSTYAEISPSQTGVKAFFAIDPADIAELRATMGRQHGRQFKKPTGSYHPPAIELHISNRYFTVTWSKLNDAPDEIRMVPLADLRWLIEEAGPSLTGKAPAIPASAPADESILVRLARAADASQHVRTALANAGSMKGGSRSEGALGLGGALCRAGWSMEDVKAALSVCPATREWAREAKDKQGDRQFQRIWEKAAGQNTSAGAHVEGDGPGTWPEPLDFLADADLTGAPELQPHHLPEAIRPFVFDTAARLGVDPAAVALAAIVSLASVMDDDWEIQPKQNDYLWTENPRLWGAIVGDPSMLKTPIIRTTTAPLDRLEAQAGEQHKKEMRDYRTKMKKWKEEGADPETEPTAPRRDRFLIEGATTEAISEVLRDDEKATMRAPAGKILSRQDEMSEWIAGLDRYRTGGNGSADRGAYIRLYNGGRYNVDRVNRGAFPIPNWSCCMLGGIQPGPIQQIAKGAADDGLLQRFCYCVPASQRRGEDRRPDAEGLARYADLFHILLALKPDRAPSGKAERVVLHADAHRYRLEILDLVEALSAMPDASPRLKSALGKWPGLWARMTIVFHLIGLADARAQNLIGNDVANVARGAAQAATSYLREILLPHLLRADAIMFATEQTGHARWIAGYILSKGEERITARDIIRACGALRAPEKRKEMQGVMESLEAMGWVRAAEQSDGRPTTTWFVNPKIHLLFATRAQKEREQREATKERIRATLSKHLKPSSAIQSI